MNRIAIVEENQAQGVIKDLYSQIKNQMGIVPNVIKVFSSWPELFSVHMSLFQTIMTSETKLPRSTKEMIAALVSEINKCNYCATHHVNFMKQYGVNESVAEMIRKDYRKAGLDKKTLMLLEYAEEVTRHAHQVTDGDVARLKQLGWTDGEILEATAVVAEFSFINRVADALGVELE